MDRARAVALLLAGGLLAGTAAGPALAGSDGSWVGINPGHGALLADADYARAAARETTALGLGLARIGIDGVGGDSVGAPFDWTARDRAIDIFRAAGIEVRGVVSFRSHVAQAGDVDANWRHFVREVALHYRGRIGYYIIDNEPDRARVPPELAVARACAAYAEIKAVDPAIRVESPPTASAGAAYLGRMIELGVTRCADVLGVHSYGAQLDEGDRQGLDRPWRLMARSGQPVIPVADSEGGNSYTWAPRGAADPYRWQARWYRLAWLQHKRYGYDSLMLFSLRSPQGLWDVASWQDGRFVPNAPVAAAVLGYQRRPFADGGFEAATGPDSPWITVTRLAEAEPDSAGIDLAAGQARSGLHALRMQGPGQVRQVAELLTPGQPLRLSAWVRVEDAATAQLKALGFDRLAGDAEIVASAERSTDGAWRELALTVTPTRSWVVVSLEATGAGAVTWDDVALVSR